MKEVKQQFIYGIHPVEEALRTGKTLERIYVTRERRDKAVNDIMHTAVEAGVPVQQVPAEKLSAITKGTHQGIVAVVSPVQFYKLDDVIALAYEKGETPFLLMADRITDVRNFGAMTRTCFGAGVHAVIVPYTETSALNADAVKSSAGALTRIQMVREKNLVQCIKQLKLHGVKVMATDAKAPNMIYDCDLTVPVCIVLGSEGEGVQTEILRVCDEMVKLPMPGDIDSYNVSVSAGMLLYEVMRQRG